MAYSRILPLSAISSLWLSEHMRLVLVKESRSEVYAFYLSRSLHLFFQYILYASYFAWPEVFKGQIAPLSLGWYTENELLTSVHLLIDRFSLAQWSGLVPCHSSLHWQSVAHQVGDLGLVCLVVHELLIFLFFDWPLVPTYPNGGWKCANSCVSAWV